SASGLDPHISPKNAELQSPRIATERKLGLEDVARLVRENTEGPFLGFIGEPGVNVVKLNLALDKTSTH
ncbi:MAG: potassium-transporting ATPase subunit C, partial [Acidobacteriota bacterium]